MPPRDTSADSDGSPRQTPRLTLEHSGSLRRGLGRSFLAIVNAAAAAAASGEPRAVHETRKAMRRARSVVDLAREALPVEIRSSILTHLREAHSSLSNARDAQVLDRTLEIHAGDDIQPGLRDRILLASATNRDADAIVELAATAYMLGALGPIFAGELGRVHWQDLERSLTRSLRRAKTALRRANDLPSTHLFRRRNKTVVYQLELLASLGGQKNNRFRQRLAATSEQLGEIADLGAAESFLSQLDRGAADDNGPAPGRAPDAERMAGLRLTLTERAECALAQALSDAKRCYRGRPEKIAAQTIRRARRRR